ncbi:MAG: hypothetical protein E6713_14675 [Sporomusaceae bacterium]|nr:hypothetical protein [Sporomusaceae bacterium]
MAEILDFYRENYDLYSAFIQDIQDRIQQLLLQEEISVHLIVSRLKTEESLRGKINKGRGKYREFEDITDVCGLRIITYFADDIDRVAKIIAKVLQVDPVNSIDKRKILAPNQFGYLSSHIIASLPDDVIQQEPYRRFQNCKVEIQIRSVLQHAWAEIEHDLAYKTDTPVSSAVRRRFSRVAGLLEVADDEFCKLRREQKTIAAFAGRQRRIPFTLSVDSSASFTPFQEIFSLNKVAAYLCLGIILTIFAIHEPIEVYMWHSFLAFLHSDSKLFLAFISSHTMV